jgi:multidrug transporter EmrE-like cation transporter
MLFLLLSILCSALIGNLLFWFQKDKNAQFLQIFLGNYFLASLFSLASNDTSWAALRTFDVGLGVLAGIFFLLNLVVYQRNIHINGVALSASVMRVGLLIPAFTAIIFFNDSIRIINYVGIGVVMLAFMSMADTKFFSSIWWIVLLFVVTGITETSLKIYDEFGLPTKGMFVFILFTTAFLINFVWILVQKRKIHWPSLLYGLALGIPNQLTTRFFLKSLETVSAAIAFPLMASGVVLFCIVADRFIWKIQFSLKEKIAFSFVVLGIALLNIQ